MDKEVLIMRVQCCVCKKVKKSGAWRESSKSAKPVPVSHSYCPSCFNAAMEAIRAERAAELMAYQRNLAAAGL